MAVGRNSWKWRRDGHHFVPEVPEPIGIRFHGKLVVQRQVAFRGAQFAPILGRERSRQIVGSEQDTFAAGWQYKHIDVLSDRTRQRFKKGNVFTAADFPKFLVQVTVLLFVTRKEHPRGKTSAIF